MTKNGGASGCTSEIGEASWYSCSLPLNGSLTMIRCRASTNWLRPDSGFELPVHYRADLLLLLGEAELRLGRDSAPTTLRTAVDIMEKHYASGSRSLAWGRQLLAGKMVEQ